MTGDTEDYVFLKDTYEDEVEACELDRGRIKITMSNTV